MHPRHLLEPAKPQSTAFTRSHDRVQARGRRMYRAAVLTLLSSLLVACPGAVRPPPPAPALPAPVATDLQGAAVYAIDPASDVLILVFRGGTLARLGHNHVMTAKSLTGKVWINREPSDSGFELSFPVAELVVDDPQARQAAGSDFPGEISQSDRDGTRKNMLRAEVLDAEHFERVQLRSIQVTGPWPAARIVTRVTIKNVSRDIEMPVTVEVTSGRVTASGQFNIKQTDFGIKPFSVGLGALEVVDQLQIRFKIIATRQ